MTKKSDHTPLSESSSEEASEGLPMEESPAFTMPDSSAGFALAEAACWFLTEKNAEDIVILDLRGFSDVCDFFVIAHGNSDVQVNALARQLRDKLGEHGHRARNVEGLGLGHWVLLDFFDVVVHVFREDTRRYYQLERLWGDAGRLDVPYDWFRDPQVAARHPELNFIFAPGAETQGS